MCYGQLFSSYVIIIKIIIIIIIFIGILNMHVKSTNNIKDGKRKYQLQMSDTNR